MNRNSARFVGTAFAASSLLLAPTTFAAGSTNGVTALLVGGEGSYAQLTEEQMVTAFGGYFANYDQRISVPFPGDAEFAVSIPEGSDNLYNAIYAHQADLGTPLTIGGVSKGAPSVVDVLYRLMADAADAEDGMNPPGRQHMTVAIYGAPNKVFFLGVKYQPLPETPWNTMIVSAEYDGIADFPDNPFNVLALLNAVAGAEIRHVDAAFYDVNNNPVYYRVDTNSLGAETTTVVIPTDRLPLLEDMYESDFWDPGYVRWLEKVLRPIIDSAYKRHWPSQRNLWKEGIVPMPAPPAGDTLVDSGAPEYEPAVSGEDVDAEPFEAALSDDGGDDAEYVGRHRNEAGEDSGEITDEDIAVNPEELATDDTEEPADESEQQYDAVANDAANDDVANDDEAADDANVANEDEPANTPDQEDGADSEGA